MSLESAIRKLYAYATGRVGGAGYLQRTPPGSVGPLSMNEYGGLLTQPLDRKWLALHGKYFTAHNATNDAATTLAGHAAPLLADADDTMTKPFLFARVPAGASKLVIPDSIEIEVVTAGATATQACWAAQLDTGATRRTSGGTNLTIVNPNMQSTEASILASGTLMGGAVVTGAESASVRELGHGTLRPSIEIAGDKKIFVFGGDAAAIASQSDAAATAIRTSLVVLPQPILGATDQLLLALHGQAAQNAAGIYKVRFSWWELGA